MAKHPGLSPEVITVLRSKALEPNPLSAIGKWAKTLASPLDEEALLELSEMLEMDAHPRLVYYTLRAASGYEPVPGSKKVVEWLHQNANSIGKVLEPDLRTCSLVYSDWSVTAPDLMAPEQYDDAAGFTERIWADIRSAGAAAAIGGYNHIRPAYGGGLFATQGGARTVHIGLDVFIEAGSPVFAPLDGTVHSLANNAAKFDYGPCVVLEHRVAPEIPTFYTLYGHLSLDSLGLEPDQDLKKGEMLGRIGNYPENGDWPPHLHLQLIMDMLDKKGDFNGSCHPDHLPVWLSLCPDANLINQVPEALFPKVPAELRCRENAPIVARGPNGQAYDACGQQSCWG